MSLSKQLVYGNYGDAGTRRVLFLLLGLLILSSCAAATPQDEDGLGATDEDTNVYFDSDTETHTGIEGDDTETFSDDSDTDPKDPDTDTITDLDSDSNDSAGTDFDSETDTDECPNDDQKLRPGICGCGVADIDSDDDGTLDCDDGCPNDAEKIERGECGCKRAEGTCTDESNTMALRYHGEGIQDTTKQKIYLEANTQYDVSVDLRTAAESLGQLVFDTNDRFDPDCQKVVGASAYWIRFTCSFNSGLYTDVTIRAFAANDQFLGYAYWDNIVVTAQGSTTNLVANGDFENGLAGWTVPNDYFTLTGESLPPLFE